MVDNSNKISFSRITYWFIINVAFMSLLIAATNYNIIWAETVLLFFLWLFGSILILALLLNKETYYYAVEKHKDRKIKEGKSVPLWIDSLVDLIFIGILVANGWWWTAGLYVLQMFIIAGVKQKAEE